MMCDTVNHRCLYIMDIIEFLNFSSKHAAVKSHRLKAEKYTPRKNVEFKPYYIYGY